MLIGVSQGHLAASIATTFSAIFLTSSVSSQGLTFLFLLLTAHPRCPCNPWAVPRASAAFPHTRIFLKTAGKIL